MKMIIFISKCHLIVQGAKYGFAIHELRTVFGTLQIEIINFIKIFSIWRGKAKVMAQITKKVNK